MVQLETMTSEFEIFNKSVSEWKHWYDNITEKRKGVRSKPDSNMRDFIKSLLYIRNEKFDNVLSITSIGESLLPFLSMHGRERIKSLLKITKEQWHEIFDELPISLDVLEGKIKKNETLVETLEQLRIEFQALNASLVEEVEERNPLKIIFQFGLENKERQLQRFSELKQNFNSLDYGIKRLEDSTASDEEDDFVRNVNDLRDEFKLSKELLENAKTFCLQSCQNHQTFENVYLKVQDHLNTLKKKILLCEVIDGTVNSLEGRMARIQV